MSEITAAAIEAARTPAGGWTKETLASWGVSWPPPKGWRKALLAGAEPTPRFTNLGEQVLDRGAHYADARDIPAAEAIASALNELPALVEVYHAAHDYLHSVHRTSTWVASQRLSAALKAVEPSRPTEQADAA